MSDLPPSDDIVASSNSPRSDAAVVDAGVIVATVIRTTDSPRVARLWDGLETGHVLVYAPALWRYELTSVLRRYVFDGLLTESGADGAVRRAIDLGILGVDESPDFHVTALRWASRLTQRAAYDSFYVSAAEMLGTELWTCDGRLARRALQIGAPWVREVER
jgi:predicted nucleic acid-binding protein